MVLIKTLTSHQFYSFLIHQNTSFLLQTRPRSFPNVHEYVSRIGSFFSSSFLQRNIYSVADLVSSDVIEERIGAESTASENVESSMRNSENRNEVFKKREKTPLNIIFKEAVGISERQEESEFSEEDESEKEIRELMKKLRKLETEIRSVRGSTKITEKKKNRTSKIEEEEEEKDVSTVQSKPKSLSSLFLTENQNNLRSVAVKNLGRDDKSDASKGVRVLASVALKPFEELSPEIVSLLNRLYEDGYLKKANFLPPNTLDISCFSSYYSRDFLRFAAEKFGQDHQESIRSLSEADLKRIALFGCPSIERRTAFAAKRLRSFFGIQEDIVCRTCKLKSSCTVVNQRVWKKMEDLSLADVMRVLTLYALDLVPSQLLLPDEIKGSVRKLLKEVLNISQKVSATPEDPYRSV